MYLDMYVRTYVGTGYRFNEPPPLSAPLRNSRTYTAGRGTERHSDDTRLLLASHRTNGPTLVQTLGPAAGRVTVLARKLSAFLPES